MKAITASELAIAIYVVIISLSIIVFPTHAETCSSKASFTSKEIDREVNTPARQELKKATIQVYSSSGKLIGTLPSDEYMVVPRKQKVTDLKIVTEEHKLCRDERKNLVTVGAREDFTGLTSESNSKSAKISSNTGLVLDATYMRENIVGPVGAGLGLDTNGTPKAFLGLEF